MATKLCSLTPTLCFSTTTSINTRTTSSCLPNTKSKTTIKIYPFQFQQIGKTPLIPAVRASSGPNSSEPDFQEDLTYLLKITAGSILGAALIKYGSAIIPDITRPNITQALLMISSPVVIAVLLLFNGSRKE
ncbi:hypothetical protein SOVF_170650 [Spinacia oleracea]|uniref:Uncharacterized protein n=1 Tax=Spinacia oleracea TaxID=3562 RepID=A0A9R0I817_SPIOL|nr:uncharacterized protein LOC110784228 [Spinacia oleracea]KNA07558.1 hypothetical protein SOVF_170650 [Spinacia oleracea]